MFTTNPTIVLAKPSRYSPSTKIFQVTKKGNFIVIGGSKEVQEYLKTCDRSFGIGHQRCCGRPPKWSTYTFATNGIRISQVFRPRNFLGDHYNFADTVYRSRGIRSLGKKAPNRKYYVFEDEKTGIEILRVRRMPTKWLDQLDVTPIEESQVACDFLEDHGFYQAAQVLRNHLLNPKGPI
jgi:hypothetical protein